MSSDLFPRTLVWFSCGAASAVAAKLAVASHKGPGPIEVLYCEMANEHPDNLRFREEVQQWIGSPIVGLRSSKFPSMDIYDVFLTEKYVAGIYGASCTRALKRQVRIDYQRASDVHIFGYTVDEKKRILDFEENNPTLTCSWILSDLGVSKKDCYGVLQMAGIELPVMYKLGYNNNNCLGCVKGGAGYWNKIREDFPETFTKAAEVTRALGVRLLKVKKQRIFLDELEPGTGRYEFEGDIDCGPQCVLPRHLDPHA